MFGQGRLQAMFTPRDSGGADRRSMGRDVANLLAFARFLAVAIVVSLTVVVQNQASQELQLVVIATVAAALSVLIVGLGSRLSRVPVVAYALLSADAALAVAGIFAGGGVDSPFLLYALLPVLTAALLLNLSFALFVAVLPALTVVLAHTVLNAQSDRFAWILEGNYLTLVPVYSFVSIAVAVLPFYANLNLRLGEQDRARRSEQRILRAELHDKLAQSLSALTLGLRQLDRVGGGSAQVGELADVSERSYADLRELLDLLEAGSWQPTTVGTLGRLVESWADETGIDVKASMPDEDLQLPPEVSLAMLGIAREALTNIGKHSGAKRVWVTLKRTSDSAELTVRDDGRGFAEDRAPGHGRRIMQERAESVGATLDVSSEPGAGTEVRVLYPVQ